MKPLSRFRPARKIVRVKAADDRTNVAVAVAATVLSDRSLDVLDGRGLGRTADVRESRVRIDTMETIGASKRDGGSALDRFARCAIL